MPSRDDFVHLHNHSQHSLLDGYGTLKEIIQCVSDHGQPAVAVTDHGNLGAAYDLVRIAQNTSVKPIVGMEAYVAPGGTSRDQKVSVAGYSGSGKYSHLTLLAQSAEGAKNLFKLSSRASSEGFYLKPRIDLDLLEVHREGIIVLSGCAGSELSTRVRTGEPTDEYVQWMRDRFPGKFFIEVMDHGICEPDLNEWELNEALLRIADRHSLPVVATNDAHYVLKESAGTHEALLALQTGAKLSDEKRFKFNGEGYHLKTRAEMEMIWPKEYLDNTLRIAEMVEGYPGVFDGAVRFPTSGSLKVDENLLKQNCRKSPRFRYGMEDRLNFELEVIISKGYPGYFLCVAECISLWKEAGISVGPGRGSAGGSLVAFLLGITDVDPLQHGLLFERFLNPDRPSLPDIDLDISQRDRAKAIKIVIDHFGEDRVAHLGTFGTMLARDALLSAARVLGRPVSVGRGLVALLPKPKFGKSAGLSEDDFTEDDDLIHLEDGDFHASTEEEVIKLAFALEGRIKSAGVHAAGVVISPVDLPGVLPLRKDRETGNWITQWSMYPVESVGSIKMDFLGLRNLDIIRDTLDHIGGTWDDLPTVPKDCSDEKAYDLLRAGSTFGVFQLDSPGMQSLLREVRPTAFSDISAVLALYRPGPMGVDSHRKFARRKNAREAVTLIHPELDTISDILEDTYGLIVYQEQVMEIARQVAGYSLAEADNLRRAMGKKDHNVLAAAYAPFREGMKENGYTDDCVSSLWEVLVPFADYAFNKSHTAAYGLLSYWTAFLKANFPSEYMSALLSSVGNPDKLGTYLEESRRMGLVVSVPDINDSGDSFTPGRGKILYGLGQVKGLGGSAVQKIYTHRPFRDLRDVVRRSGLNSANLGAVASSGGLDNLDGRRELVVAGLDNLLETVKYHDSQKYGQPVLWTTGSEQISGIILPDVSLRREWELSSLQIALSVPEQHLWSDRWLTEDEYIWIERSSRPSDGNMVLHVRSATIRVLNRRLPVVPAFLVAR